jgi:hypothetical protein
VPKLLGIALIASATSAVTTADVANRSRGAAGSAPFPPAILNLFSIPYGLAQCQVA